MNTLNNHSHDDAGEAGQALRDDLAQIYRLPVPPIAFVPVPEQLPPRQSSRRWRPALLAGAAAGLLLLVAGSSLLDGSTPEVSAETIFERTKEVTAATSATQLPLNETGAYHMVSRSETSFAGGGTTAPRTRIRRTRPRVRTPGRARPGRR